MHQAILISLIVVSLSISGFILLQAQGSGFGATWSGGGETYHTKRGVEKVVFWLTIVLVGVFMALSLAIHATG